MNDNFSMSGSGSAIGFIHLERKCHECGYYHPALNTFKFQLKWWCQNCLEDSGIVFADEVWTEPENTDDEDISIFCWDHPSKAGRRY